MGWDDGEGGYEYEFCPCACGLYTHGFNLMVDCPFVAFGLGRIRTRTCTHTHARTHAVAK